MDGSFRLCIFWMPRSALYGDQKCFASSVSGRFKSNRKDENNYPPRFPDLMHHPLIHHLFIRSFGSQRVTPVARELIGSWIGLALQWLSRPLSPSWPYSPALGPLRRIIAKAKTQAWIRWQCRHQIYRRTYRSRTGIPIMPHPGRLLYPYSHRTSERVAGYGREAIIKV